MSEMDAPESEKEQLTLAGHLDRPFSFLTYPRYTWA